MTGNLVGKFHRKRIWALLALIFSISIAKGASISGYLTDSENGEPLPYANVFLEGTSWGSSTNEKGFFLIEGIQAGRYVLHATYLGYQEYAETLTIAGDERIRRNIAIVPLAEVGAEIVVEARREGGEKDLTVGHLILSREQTRYMPQLLEPDLFRTMHLLPGVASPSDFTSALYIWGGIPTQNLVTLDGIEVYNATHLGGVFSAFVIDAIKEVNLIKGGFPAKWGGRTGSVLEIINREGDRKKIHGSGEISLLSSQGTLHGPFPKSLGSGAWMVSARRTYFDLVLNTMYSDEEMQFPYHFVDFHAKLTKDLKGGDKVSLTFYHGADVFNLEDEYDTTHFKWGNNTVSANYTHLFSPKLFGHFLAAYSKFGDDFEASGEDFVKDYVQDFTVRGMMSTAFPNHSVEGGLEIKYLSILNKIQFREDLAPFWNWKNETGIISLYLQDEWDPHPLWQLEAGVRNEYCTSGKYFRFSPRISAMRILDTKLRLKFAAGQYYQYFQGVPKNEELGLSLFDTWVLCQEGLKPTWATHLVLRGETEHLWDLPITADVYYKKMGSLWRHKEFYSPSNYFPDLFEIGSGWSSGADLMIRFNAKRLAGWFAYSLSFVVNSFPSVDEGAPYYAKYDRRHDLSINCAYDLGRGYTAGAVWKYNSGMPYTEPIGIYQYPYISDLDQPVWWWNEFYYGGFHNKRVPDYHRLDLSLAHRAVYSWGDLEWYLQVLNVYNHKNIYTYTYYGYGERDSLTMFPIFPSVGLRIWF